MTEREAFEAWWRDYYKLPADWKPDFDIGEVADMFAAHQAATLAERARVAKRCAEIVTDWQVPVGNSDAGVLASQWTLDELRGVRAMILAEFPEAK